MSLINATLSKHISEVCKTLNFSKDDSLNAQKLLVAKKYKELIAIFEEIPAIPEPAINALPAVAFAISRERDNLERAKSTIIKELGYEQERLDETL